MTAEEVSEYLKVPVATLYARRYRKVGPPVLRVGRHLRYRESDVVEVAREPLSAVTWVG